jgi:hypothetical protein
MDVLLKANSSDTETDSDVDPKDTLVKALRTITLAHRVKALVKDGEKIDSSPTKVMIAVGEDNKIYELETEQDELDFVNGVFPIKWETLSEESCERAGSITNPGHLKWKKVEDFPDWAPEVLRKVEKESKGKESKYVVKSFASEYIGLTTGDRVLMCLGGSGDPLAYAISRKGESVGFELFRLPPSILKDIRGEKPSDKKVRDTSELETLLVAWDNNPNDFYKSDPADRIRLEIAVLFNNFKDAQRMRMAHAARLRQTLIGKIFMDEQGLFPEGIISRMSSGLEEVLSIIFKKKSKKEKLENLEMLLESLEYDDDSEKFLEIKNELSKLFKSSFKTKSNSLDALNTFIDIEKEAKSDLEKAVQDSYLYPLFEHTVGAGPSIIGALIAGIDIRRSVTEAQFWAFSGLHSLKSNGEKFQKEDKPVAGIQARRRSTKTMPLQKNNWKPMVRQALYTLADQFNRRPNSYWGAQLLKHKANFRIKYPEPIIVDDKIKYNDGHIHNMALWKTLRYYTRWLYKEWKRLEKDRNYVVKQKVKVD